MTRTWEVNGPICENRGGWRKGVVASVDPWRIAVRWDGAELVSFRAPADVGLVDPEQVPIDERHWLPEQVRDQLVRQEAAGRLLAMADAVLGAEYSEPLVDLADDLNDLLIPGQEWLTCAARALLALPPRPTTTP